MSSTPGPRSSTTAAAPASHPSTVARFTGAVPTAAISAAGLLGGYLVARETGVRPLGGAVLGGLGLWAGVRTWRRVGPVTAIGLAVAYLGGFGASHPLARQIGAWPAVLSVTAVNAALGWWFADRRRR